MSVLFKKAAHIWSTCLMDCYLLLAYESHRCKFYWTVELSILIWREKDNSFYRYHFIYIFFRLAHAFAIWKAHSKAIIFIANMIPSRSIRGCNSSFRKQLEYTICAFSRLFPTKADVFFRRFVAVDTSIDRNANKRIACARIVSAVKWILALVQYFRTNIRGKWGSRRCETARGNYCWNDGTGHSTGKLFPSGTHSVFLIVF